MSSLNVVTKTQSSNSLIKIKEKEISLEKLVLEAKEPSKEHIKEKKSSQQLIEQYKNKKKKINDT